ncbi:MAG TPA: HAMP domain-containing histidine kinase [Candidatus Pullilachnospira stercoravium]|uniref:histidine kinase n=1 Tax=Candidatus Pullilachnospira stercoravium TaxID=2840913 RepID=A0A9D1NSY6_9FIRM|nr:HAMP domain-containing histidine kinase [Candidatus Pullilachnospira stercoravium]
MRREEKTGQRTVKNSLFPLSLFGIFLGVLFLMSGIHVGLVVLMNSLGWNELLQTLVPMTYWGLVAMGLTFFTRKKMRDTYEEPLHRLAEGTRKVAEGDFSVYVPTVHTSSRLDYLDVMILDFNKMVEELGSVETLKTDFVSNVSHEMKTPIAVIKNYAELLQTDRGTEEERREYARNIEEAAARLSTLISNILKLNKLENQSIDPDIEDYDLSGQLEMCILQYEELWDKKELELEVDIAERVNVRADRSLMELVWNNLLSNAVKFTEPGGTVTIRQRTAEGQVEVSVTDTGCGMSQESIRHIFDKFYQGDTSHAREGNGLGLALVKRIIDLMNGEITVVSRPGQGSTFTVRLPAADERE